MLGRTSESIREQELGFLALGCEVARDARTVTAWIFPSAKRTAVYQDGRGVALSLDGDIRRLQAQARPDLISTPDRLKEQP